MLLFVLVFFSKRLQASVISACVNKMSTVISCRPRLKTLAAIQLEKYAGIGDATALQLAGAVIQGGLYSRIAN